MRAAPPGWFADNAVGASVREGKAGSYRECFEQAVNAAIAGATVLTANTRSARRIHAAAEERLRLRATAWPTPAWLTPNVLPYGAFVEQLYSDAVVAGAIKLHALQREQELQLWRQVIERSPSGREMLLPDSAAALAAESFRNAIEYGIALDGAAMSASSDTRAFSGWAAEFRRQLSAHGWICPALFTHELAACLPSLRLPQRVFVFLADFTPAQRLFLSALEGAGVEVTLAPEFAAHSEEGSPAHRYHFDGVSDELLAAAHWTRQQLQSSPEARIGVIVFDLDRKLPQVESAFRSVLHPEHLLGARTPAAFEIASPRALADYPVVRCALQLLGLFAAPIDFYSFHAMLSSPYLAGVPEPIARLLAAARSKARLQVSFDDLARWLRESTHGPGDVPELRAALGRLPAHAAFSSQQPTSYWAKIAREILQAFGWPGGLSLALGSEEFQCTQSWGELFSAIASLEVLERRTDFRGFVARLERAAATRNFKPETLNAPVQIMDLAESEGSLFDALWIGGCSDDRWPDSPRFSPLIPVALLKAAGVAVEGTPQADSRIARITARLLQSAPRLSLSLALRADDEREQRWSPLFTGLPLASEPVNTLPPLAARFPPAALEAILDAKAPALAAGELPRGGTWLLQEQSNCPFRAFAIRRLLAHQDEGPNEALAPTERGKVIDRALQLIWEELRNSRGLQRPDCPAILAASVDAAMVSVLPPANDPWTQRFRAIERRRTIDVLTEWLAVEAARKPFHVLAHQQKVELTLGGLVLHGCLDRLDEIGEDGAGNAAHVVIDYKSGAVNSVSAWRVPRPRLPQLPFYAIAMLRQKLNLGGISFATVRRGECGFKGYLRTADLLPGADSTKRSFDGVPFDEYAPRWEEELERIAASFAQGDAAVDPRIPPGRSNSPCEHCHLASLCRIGDEVDDDCAGESEGESDE